MDSSKPHTDQTAAEALIPTEYEPRAPAPRQPGGMSGPAYGSDDAPAGAATMDADTIAEHEKEGGGAQIKRRR